MSNTLEGLLYGYRYVKSTTTTMPDHPTLEFAGAGAPTITDDSVNKKTILTFGSGGYTPPTGTGLTTVTGGVQDAASLALGTGVAAFFTTPSSANLLAALTTKTGTGLAMFGTSPTIKTSFVLRNPADTFSYTFTPGAILADRALSLPVLGSDDTLVCLAATQVLTNKTYNVSDNTLTSTSQAAGDLLVNNGTKFVRIAMGTALQVLRVNAGATGLEWAAAAGGSTPTGTGLRKIVAGVEAAAAALLLDADVDAAAAIAGTKISPNFSTLTTIVGGLRRTTDTDAVNSGTVNNYALSSTTSALRFTNVGGVNLSGIANGTAGRSVVIMNLTGTSLSLLHASASSSAANRFNIPYAASLTLNDGVCIECVYDDTSSVWRPVCYF